MTEFCGCVAFILEWEERRRIVVSARRPTLDDYDGFNGDDDPAEGFYRSNGQLLRCNHWNLQAGDDGMGFDW